MSGSLVDNSYKKEISFPICTSINLWQNIGLFVDLGAYRVIIRAKGPVL